MKTVYRQIVLAVKDVWHLSDWMDIHTPILSAMSEALGFLVFCYWIIRLIIFLIKVFY